MKALYAELTDINGTKHVANLSEMPDPPSTIVTAERLLINLRWIKIQDDLIINMDHVITFKIKEQ
jgi:hypothetical protein